jgi:hypothetical protein
MSLHAFPRSARVERASVHAQQAGERTRLRLLARKIRDEAHLDEILADLPDPQRRAAVRDLLIPLLTFTVSDATAD